MAGKCLGGSGDRGVREIALPGDNARVGHDLMGERRMGKRGANNSSSRPVQLDSHNQDV